MQTGSGTMLIRAPGISAKISDRLEAGTLLSYKLQNDEKTRPSDLIKTPTASHEQLLREASQSFLSSDH